jgi:hypothetical protein
MKEKETAQPVRENHFLVGDIVMDAMYDVR